MQKTNFNQNINGKLLANTFVTVRLHDGTYSIGEKREILLNHNHLGTGQVMSIRTFELQHLPDIISFVDCGGHNQYLKTMLRRFYSNTEERTPFDVVAIKWIARDPQATQSLFENAWKKLEEDFTPSLFNQ